MPKLTRTFLKSLTRSEKLTIHFDGELKGFGLLARPTGADSWIVEFRENGGGRGERKCRLKIGDCAVMTPEEARWAAKVVLAGVTKGEAPATERAGKRAGGTVRDLAEGWVEGHVKVKLKPATLDFYRGILDSHILPALGARKAASVTRADISQLHRDVARKAEGPARPGAKRGAPTKTRGGRATANRAMATFKALWAWGTVNGYLPEEAPNPARKVEMFNEEGRERFLSSEELGRLGAALALAEGEGLPWAEVDEAQPNARHLVKPERRVTRFDAHSVGAVRLLMFTGMRLREVLNLRWVEIELERGTIRLPDSKTGRKSVALGAPALAVLASLPRVGKFVIASTSAGSENEAPRRDLKRVWGALCRHAGLEGVRLHDLRHGFASVGVGDEGLSLFQVGQLLGHARPETTQRYSHLANDPQRRAADMIAGTISRATGFTAEVVDLEERRARG